MDVGGKGMRIFLKKRGVKPHFMKLCPTSLHQGLKFGLTSQKKFANTFFFMKTEKGDLGCKNTFWNIIFFMIKGDAGKKKENRV